MIHEIGSDNLASFKTLRFHEGLNILLADKSEGAGDRQSRNGAGKTSFVELVHFLFGADARPDSIFRSDALDDCTFYTWVSWGDSRFRASRSGHASSRIELGGDLQSLDSERLVQAVDEGRLPLLLDSSHTTIKSTEWRDLLGKLWFGLPAADKAERFTPRFRSLFSMAARRQQSGGFLRPEQHSERQQTWDQQVATSYLVGLDPSIPAEFQELRAQERDAKELRRSALSGELRRYIGKAAELRTLLTVSEARAAHLRAQLETFQVVEHYADLEGEASDITRQASDMSVNDVADQELIRELQAALVAESAPGTEDLQSLYREAGVVLPDATRRRLAEVERFHATIVENRRSHLAAEIESAEARVAERHRRKARLDSRRAEIMRLLQSGGALEHYTDIREELGRIEGECQTLRQRLEVAERLESTRTRLDMERSRLVEQLRDDVRERDDIVREAILRFEELSQSLYERAGSLTVSATRNGPSFDVHIEGERSRGITNMQIFCFDMMLTEMGMGRGRWPGFLIHDSHLFDGVDERQVAKALQLGAERAESQGFQYIVTLNSDAVPNEGFRRSFDLYDHVMEPRLTDAEETGGLFGLRFA
ncbi:MAG: DUF2326 domain-containing protein [Gammaproteobacteria bacterium]|nr:DUF2326 domain-containing protein [Gammaproteobacteria bacterium]